jgi:hypothetical protein
MREGNNRGWVVGPGDAERAADAGIAELARQRIVVGAPVPDFAHPFIGIPSVPHVFAAESIHLSSRHGDYDIDRPVLMACHGIAGSRREWLLLDGKRSVQEAFTAYQQTAGDFGLPPIDALIVCRPGMPDSASGIVLFSWIDAPAVAPQSDVTLTFFDPSDPGDPNRGLWMGSRHGVGPVSASAREWSYIPYHQAYWDAAARDNRFIPQAYRQAVPCG